MRMCCARASMRASERACFRARVRAFVCVCCWVAVSPCAMYVCACSYVRMRACMCVRASAAEHPPVDFKPHVPAPAPDGVAGVAKGMRARSRPRHASVGARHNGVRPAGLRRSVPCVPQRTSKARSRDGTRARASAARHATGRSRRRQWEADGVALQRGGAALRCNVVYYMQARPRWQ